MGKCWQPVASGGLTNGHLFATDCRAHQNRQLLSQIAAQIQVDFVSLSHKIPRLD
jgi:hypothetical protein